MSSRGKCSATRDQQHNLEQLGPSLHESSKLRHKPGFRYCESNYARFAEILEKVVVWPESSAFATALHLLLHQYSPERKVAVSMP